MGSQGERHAEVQLALQKCGGLVARRPSGSCRCSHTERRDAASAGCEKRCCGMSGSHCTAAQQAEAGAALPASRAGRWLLRCSCMPGAALLCTRQGSGFGVQRVAGRARLQQADAGDGWLLHCQRTGHHAQGLWELAEHLPASGVKVCKSGVQISGLRETQRRPCTGRLGTG